MYCWCSSKGGDEESPYRTGGLSPYQFGTSQFSRSRVRYRRELVQPSAKNPWAPRPQRTMMRPAPNAMPARKTSMWQEPNMPFSIQFPSRVESMLFRDPLLSTYIPEPFATMDRDGSILIPDVDLLVRHSFDKTCKHLLHRALENLVIHNVEGSLKAYLWKPGSLEGEFAKNQIQKCVESLPDLAAKIAPYKQKLVEDGDVLHIPKGWFVGMEDVDDTPHTMVSFGYRKNAAATHE